VVLAAPLTKAKRSLEVPLFGFAALSQFVFWNFYRNDDKYTALTLITLIFCYGLIGAFASREAVDRLVARFRGSPAKPAEAR